MSWVSKYSPMPGFPEYSGPYKVGTGDFEVQVSKLSSPAPAPDSEIASIQYRVFYPCEPSARESYIRWLNKPQTGHVQAFARFLGAGNVFSQLFSYFPHLFYFADIPARRNAAPLSPHTSSGKWPVMIFSHGLAGSRNTYSEICGSLASYGMVVIAPEHRDGSAPVSYQRTARSNKFKPIPYRPASHTPSPEVYEHRDNQLRIRLWELGLVHNAVSRMQDGSLPLNAGFCETNREYGELLEVLKRFKGQLDIGPGKIVFAGHSFGAATAVQMIKSVFYNLQSSDSNYRALYTPTPGSAITQQITSKTPAILLDMWCLPLQSPSTEWLWSRPLPCYAPGGPGGSTILAVLSEAFYKWRGNMDGMKLACSEDPTDESASSSPTKTQPHFFYPEVSAHLSQSDFAMLFPRLTRFAFKAGDPQRCLDLNVRAILQALREAGFDVSGTSKVNLQEYSTDGLESKVSAGRPPGDWRILAKNGGVEGWKAIDLAGAQGSDSEGSGINSEASSVTNKWKSPEDAVMDGDVLGGVREQTD